MNTLLERTRDLKKRTARLQKSADYADQYIDSFEFLLIGVALGILGGVWGNIINTQLHALFGSAYIPVLSIVTLVALYILSFPVRRARKMVNENFSEINAIKKEMDDIEPDLNTPRPPSESL